MQQMLYDALRGTTHSSGFIQDKLLHYHMTPGDDGKGRSDCIDWFSHAALNTSTTFILQYYGIANTACTTYTDRDVARARSGISALLAHTREAILHDPKREWIQQYDHAQVTKASTGGRKRAKVDFYDTQIFKAIDGISGTFIDQKFGVRFAVCEIIALMLTSDLFATLTTIQSVEDQCVRALDFLLLRLAENLKLPHLCINFQMLFQKILDTTTALSATADSQVVANAQPAQFAPLAFSYARVWPVAWNDICTGQGQLICDYSFPLGNLQYSYLRDELYPTLPNQDLFRGCTVVETVGKGGCVFLTAAALHVWSTGEVDTIDELNAFLDTPSEVIRSLQEIREIHGSSVPGLDHAIHSFEDHAANPTGVHWSSLDIAHYGEIEFVCRLFNAIEITTNMRALGSTVDVSLLGFKHGEGPCSTLAALQTYEGATSHVCLLLAPSNPNLPLASSNSP